MRSGIITENQFVCGLALAVGKEAQLSRPEIQKVVEYYKRPDGRVQYNEFCDMMENGRLFIVFTILSLILFLIRGTICLPVIVFKNIQYKSLLAPQNVFF